MKPIYLALLFVVIISCNHKEGVDKITHPKDYNPYLHTDNLSFKKALSEKEFWSKRLRQDSTGIGDLGPLASAYTKLYENSGELNYLFEAEKIYRKAINVSAHQKDSYVRSLAENLIIQKRFKEAKTILEESYKASSNKRATEFILFDIRLKLEEFEKADQLLAKLANDNDYNYLIRLAKRNEQQDNIDAAIKNLKQVKNIVDSRKSKSLQVKTYNDLADLYLKSDQINEAYQLYLNVLQINSDNSYSKKQIASIVYFYEKNKDEANRILDSILINNKATEYLLFKAEITE